MKLALKSLLFLLFLGISHGESLAMNGLSKEATRELIKVLHKERLHKIAKRNMTGGEVAILLSNPATAPVVPIIVISGTAITGTAIVIQFVTKGHSTILSAIKTWTGGIFKPLGSGNSSSFPISSEPIVLTDHVTKAKIAAAAAKEAAKKKEAAAARQEAMNKAGLSWLLKENAKKSKDGAKSKNPNPRNGNKKPDGTRLKNVPKRTTKEVQAALGPDWVKIKVETDTKGQPVFQNIKTGVKISPDATGHNGAIYKLLDNKTDARVASLDKDFNIIKD